MSTTLLHGLMAVTDQPIEPADGVPSHRLIVGGNLIAIASLVQHDLSDASLPPEALAEAALDHNAILTFHAARRTVLPIRFGAAFSDDAAIRRHLSDPEQAVAALTQLARLQGLQEFGVQLVVKNAPPQPTPLPGAQSGRAFLQERANLRTSRRDVTDRRSRFVLEVKEAVRKVATDLRVGLARTDRLCDIAALIERDGTDRFDGVVASLRDGAVALGLELRSSGPWPAYSFATDASDRGRDDR